jgi:prepilin-type N-terminal cleavage/methylation domain-containing protein
MKMHKVTDNQKRFTLIEISAVLVIFGSLAVTAIPKYLDMVKDLVVTTAGTAVTDLNCREKLKLVEWKLKKGRGPYPAPGTTGTAGNGDMVGGPDTKLGSDWNNNAAIISGATITFQSKRVTFTRNAPSDQNLEPWYWTVSVAD